MYKAQINLILPGLFKGINLVHLNLQRVFIYWRLSQYQKSLNLLQKMILKNPQNLFLYILSAQAHLSMGHDKKAIEYYKKIYPESNYYLQSRYEIAKILLKNKQILDLKNILSELINYSYNDWKTYIFVAHLYASIEDYNKAYSLSLKAYKIFPQKVKFLFMQGVYEERLGLFDKCILTMKKVIEVDKEYSQAYNFIGYLYAEKGIYLNKAEILIKKALELKPKDGYYLDSLGWVYFAKKQYNKALIYLKKALN